MAGSKSAPLAALSQRCSDRALAVQPLLTERDLRVPRTSARWAAITSTRCWGCARSAATGASATFARHEALLVEWPRQLSAAAAGRRRRSHAAFSWLSRCRRGCCSII